MGITICAFFHALSFYLIQVLYIDKVKDIIISYNIDKAFIPVPAILIIVLFYIIGMCSFSKVKKTVSTDLKNIKCLNKVMLMTKVLTIPFFVILGKSIFTYIIDLEIVGTSDYRFIGSIVLFNVFYLMVGSYSIRTILLARKNNCIDKLSSVFLILMQFIYVFDIIGTFIAFILINKNHFNHPVINQSVNPVDLILGNNPHDNVQVSPIKSTDPMTMVSVNNVVPAVEDSMPVAVNNEQESDITNPVDSMVGVIQEPVVETPSMDKSVSPVIENKPVEPIKPNVEEVVGNIEQPIDTPVSSEQAPTNSFINLSIGQEENSNPMSSFDSLMNMDLTDTSINENPDYNKPAAVTNTVTNNEPNAVEQVMNISFDEIAPSNTIKMEDNKKA